MPGDHHGHELRIGILPAVVDDGRRWFLADVRPGVTRYVRAVDAGEHGSVGAAPFHHLVLAGLKIEVTGHPGGQFRAGIARVGLVDGANRLAIVDRAGEGLGKRWRDRGKHDDQH